jgi:predicted lipid-binding transport protein (Tim44 family)
MDIGSLLNQAGGIGAIAQKLGVDQATVERGAGALAPHVANGIETQGLPDAEETQVAEAQAAAPAEGGMFGSGGLGGMLGGLMGGGMGGGVLGSLVGGGVGNQILGHIFGS